MTDVEAIRERVTTEDTWAYGDSGEAHTDARALLGLLDEAVELLTAMVDTAEEGWSYADTYFREKWDYEGQMAPARAFLARLGRDQ